MGTEKKDLNEKSQGKFSGKREAMKGEGRRRAENDREKSEEARIENERRRRRIFRKKLEKKDRKQVENKNRKQIEEKISKKA